MAADLDRAGRGSGGPAVRAGVLQVRDGVLQVRDSSGVLGFICRPGEIFLQDCIVLSFFVIFFMFFDDLGIDC